jgi:hypothetical protein
VTATGAREQLLSDVLASFDQSTEPRFRDVMQAVVSHLHQLATEAGLTTVDVWQAAVRGLYAVHDARRQHADNLDSDAVFGVRASLVVPFRPSDSGQLVARFDITLSPLANRS